MDFNASLQQGGGGRGVKHVEIIHYYANTEICIHTIMLN